MKFLFLMQARLGSTRRPGKTLAKIVGDKTLFECVYDRITEAKEVNKDNFFVLTTDSSKDDPFAIFMEERKIPYFRGSEQNVFKRFYDFISAHEPKPDYIIRVCCDNPFIDPLFINEITDYLKTTSEPLPEYITHADSLGHPAMQTHYGFFVEAASLGAFKRASEMDLTDVEKEHVTPQFYKSGKFSVKYLPMPKEIEVKPYRFTLDTPDDMHIAQTISAGLPEKFSYRDVITEAEKHPDLLQTMAKTISGDNKAGR